MTVLLKQLYRGKNVANREKPAQILNVNSVYTAAIGKILYFMKCSIGEYCSLY